MLRAEKARCEKLRLDVSRKEQEVQAERMKHEKLAKLSGEDASAALLKLRDETIERKDKEIDHLNQAIEDLEAEVNLSLSLTPPSRATLMN
jgi:demethoxyubiquinone hydroxylase (CLK1/Coq7/Cat5 family)